MSLSGLEMDSVTEAADESNTGCLSWESEVALLMVGGMKGGASIFNGEDVTAEFEFWHLSSAGVLK